MALVFDPITRRYVDDGLGPQGRPQPQVTPGLAAAPLAGARGGGAVIPQATITPTAGGPRGAGPAITPPLAPPVQLADVAPVQPQVAAPTPPVGLAGAVPAFDVAASDQRIRDAAAIDRTAVGTQPLNISGLNELVADRIRTTQAPAPITGARGDFNLATTSRVSPSGEITSTLRQPTNIIEGGYGGFGGGRGTAYLQQIAQQDARGAAAQQQRQREASEAVERIGLRNAMERGTPQERRAARQQIEALDQRAGLRISEAGATERQGLQLQGDVLRAETAGAAGLQAALARAAGQQQAAQVAGQFGLQQAGIAAQGRVAAAQEGTRTGTNLLAAQRARQLELQEQLLRQAQAAGDVSGTFAAAGLSRPPAQEYIDPLTGAPLSPEQVRLLQQQALSRLSPPQ